MALNFNLLRSFWHVARAGSVSRAAETAFVSQPALSKAVRELETQLGLPLFERGARGVKLTSAGQVLREHADAIFALEQEAEDAVRAQETLVDAPLRIGASTTVATYLLPPVLARFRDQFPGVRPMLCRDNTRGIEERLLRFELDVALVEGPPHWPLIEKQFWRDEELVLICAPAHPLAARRVVSPEELKNHFWLQRESASGTREVVETALARFGLPPSDAMEIGGAEALKQCVAAGLGLAWVSRESAGDQLALGRLRIVNVEGFTLRRPFYLLRLPKRPRPPAARVFEAFLGAGN